MRLGIEIARRGGMLCIAVRRGGRSLDGEAASNVRARLRHRYGERARMTVDGGTVEIELPLAE